MPDYTVVIPTIKEDIRTLESIPEEIPINIEREGTLNEARNRGVSNAETEIVVIMDDDIAFSKGTLNELATRVTPDTLIGIEDWDFDLIAGRVMVFYKDLWRNIGGFDERLGSHMGDTEFALRAKKEGYNIEQLPRQMFDHEEHARSISTWDRVWRTAYLAAKYPTSTTRLFRGVLRK